jgi:hypothetical protein
MQVKQFANAYPSTYLRTGPAVPLPYSTPEITPGSMRQFLPELQINTGHSRLNSRGNTYSRGPKYMSAGFRRPTIGHATTSDATSVVLHY